MTYGGKGELGEWIRLVGPVLVAYVIDEANWRPWIQLDEIPAVPLPGEGDSWRTDLKAVAFDAAVRIALREYPRMTGGESMLDMDAGVRTHAEYRGGRLHMAVFLSPDDQRARLIFAVARGAADAAEAVAIERFKAGRISGLRELTNARRERALAEALQQGPASMTDAYRRAGVSRSAGKRIGGRKQTKP